MSNLLRAEGVSYQVNGRSILSDIDLSFETGSNTTIVGPSGSGKSTFLKILSSLLSPTEGEIFYQEASITTMPIETYRQKVSYCFQQPTLFGETVYDNLLFPFTVRQEAFNQEKVEALLQQVKLPAAYLEKKTAELSGGERQRVALLRNIIFVPDVLLLDEVTTGLDEESKQIVNQLLNQLNKEQGVTLIRVTHDTEEIQQAQQVIRIVAGKVAPTDGFSS
ncbi:ATP-binding cassette domain-containing protein [Enterococcus faecalis]|uniref:ABC transporter ATP-binding protein n=1 Tax=Enterococcus faecalis TaxID=1351 RepID=UPI0001B2E81B|nr:ATP-binding cassette domain-containing protein [Enterococcus faecalis]EEU79610.1 ABC transporter [Enterococcus faecalis Fly1]EHZ2966462.1 ATP-binding cassette domain-containing protein [Enterococcus faecalis]